MGSSVLFCLIGCVIAAFVNSKSVETECQMTKWSEWSECIRRTPCESPKHKHYRELDTMSFPMKEALEDKGRERMKIGVRDKLRAWREREECRKANKCPERARRSSMGPVPCVNGMAGQYPCMNVDQLSFLSIADLGYGNPRPDDRGVMTNDIWGWTDPLTQDEYVIIGLSGGTSFVRTTDPENPVVLGFLETRTSSSTWRDIKVYANTAYIGSEASNHGMQVFDLTQLRGRNDFRTLTSTYDYTEFGNSHNIVVNEETGFLYAVGCTQSGYSRNCAGGLHMVDIRDPLNPRFAGCFSADGYTHDAQCVKYSGPDTNYYGREICFAYNEDSLTIVDVTNKNDPKMIGKAGYSGSMYTHQGWITEDQTMALLDDEQDEVYNWSDKRTKTYLWDITNLANPTLRATHYSPELAIDHNQYIKGDLTFQSNYEAGLRILSIDQARYQLKEVAYFDVLPRDGYRTSFDGTWSNYPYFESGVVAVSSTEYGLFLVMPRYEILGAGHLPGIMGEQHRTRNVISTSNIDKCPAYEERRECTPHKGC